MTLFSLLAGALVLVVLALLLHALVKPRAPLAPDDDASSNLRILRAQLAELDAERASDAVDAQQHASARVELERRVLDEAASASAAPVAAPGRKSAWALALGLPAITLALYLQLGNRAALEPLVAATDTSSDEAARSGMEAEVQRLADKLKESPDSSSGGWALLARSYMMLERFDEARAAYAKAVALEANNAQLLADYADALAMAQGRKLEGEPERVLLKALAIDPDHLKALALAGAAAQARNDHTAAVKHWARARALVGDDNPLAPGLDAGIAAARAALGGPAAGASAAAAVKSAAATTATATATVTAPSGAGLQVTVTLSPALAAKVQPGDTLFVFARAAEGPRMPLAVARLAAGTQAVKVQLDDSSAMSPQMKLSGAQRIVVGARVSRQGSATPAAGDLEGESAPREPRGEVQLVIDRVRP